MENTHKYRDMPEDEYNNFLENVLIDTLSYSRVMSFSRNEKEFEKWYIYRIKSKLSASAIAGQAYHLCLENFFLELKKTGELMSIAELEIIAFNYIENRPANIWKLQKTTPTVSICIEKSIKITTALLNNFYSEMNTYIDELDEIIGVEVSLSEFITLNGVDIPLQFNARIDLVFKTKSGKIIIADHKSKAKLTDEKELKFTIGKQAISYVNCFEAANKEMLIDEVWVFENKYSKNKDNSQQINCCKVEMNNDNRMLYESLLYEPVKRVVEAVSDPDHIYLINDSDNYADIAETYDFWGQTMIAEVEDFNIPDKKKELIRKRLKKTRDASISSINPVLIKKFRENAAEFIQYDLNKTNMKKEEKIEHILRTFGIITKVAHTFEGYSSDTYLVDVSAGVKLARIFTHKLDIANVLDVASIRIHKDLFVYSSKSYIAIDVSKKRDKNLFFDLSKATDMKIPIGVDNLNQDVYWDLRNHSTPHALVCGSTGSGKSVFAVSCLEYAINMGVKNIHIFDPKYSPELSIYSKKYNVYNDIIDIENGMNSLVQLMEERIRNGFDGRKIKPKDIIYVFIDEFADAFDNARKGKDLDVKKEVIVGYYNQTKQEILHGIKPRPMMKIEKVGEIKPLDKNLKILAQKGRSLGIRIMAATQRASAKTIQGDIKVNFPVQVCFRVPKEVDSKVVLDESGAESLTGLGDGLIKSPEYLNIIRFQGYFKKD